MIYQSHTRYSHPRSRRSVLLPKKRSPTSPQWPVRNLLRSQIRVPNSRYRAQGQSGRAKLWIAISSVSWPLRTLGTSYLFTYILLVAKGVGVGGPSTDPRIHVRWCLDSLLLLSARPPLLISVAYVTAVRSEKRHTTPPINPPLRHLTRVLMPRVSRVCRLTADPPQRFVLQRK